MQENLSWVFFGGGLDSLDIAAHNEAVTFVCEFSFGVFFGPPGAISLILEICRSAVLNACPVNPTPLHRLCITNVSLMLKAPIF